MGAQTHTRPNADQRLTQLAEVARYDLSCACGDNGPRTQGNDGLWIYPAAMPSGKRAPMLKVLQDGGCERGCAYCAQRHGGPGQREVSLAPEELARQFDQLQRAGRVFGLFLSSAIKGGPVRSMDRMLATAELLRKRFRFRGYLHLKLLPGAEEAQVERAMQLSTRVSINMELPTAAHLSRVAPAKRLHQDLLRPMRQVARAETEGRYNRSGQTTQFVVGAATETDQEIVRSAAWLYRKLGLARVYYSAFQPLPGTPLERQQPAPYLREHRLYQADFLLRKYGFKQHELGYDRRGHLPLDQDPKTSWAQAHPEHFPVEVNTAEPEQLMRIPGIGPTTAQRIVTLRQQGRLRSVDALRMAGASWRVAAPFVLLDGRSAGGPRQLELFG